MTTKISYKDVVNFFDGITTDMADLVLGIIKDNLARKAERRQKISVNLQKARAAKGKGSNSHQSQSSSIKADPQVQAEVAAGIPVHRGPGRPRRVVDANEAADQGQAIAETA